MLLSPPRLLFRGEPCPQEFFDFPKDQTDDGMIAVFHAEVVAEDKALTSFAAVGCHGRVWTSNARDLDDFSSSMSSSTFAGGLSEALTCTGSTGIWRYP